MATSTNYTSIAYVAEATEGEAPATPQFQLLPTTGGSPVSNVTTATSEVIREDRQTDDLTVVDADIAGDLNYELSYAPYKPLIISLLQGVASSAVNETALEATGATDKVGGAASGIDGIVNIGDVFRLTSVTEPTKVDGFYVCIDNTTTDEITIYPSFPDASAAATDLVLSITTVVSNGAEAPDSYTFRKKAINDGTPYYWYYHGCRINTMNFNFATGSILNGSLGVIGRTEDPRTTVLTGELTDLVIPSYNIMNSVNSVGTIYVEGVSLGTCSFSSLDLTVDNQTEAAKSIGVLGACATASYSVMITGNVEVFFKDLTMYNKFKAAQSFSVSIILDDDTSDTVLGNGIGINMQKCKFETLDTPISGKDAFLKQTGSFKALRDVTNDNMIKFSFIDVV